MVLAACQLQEKGQHQNADPCATVVNLIKAFHNVSHERLRKIMNKFGCLDKFIQLVRQFHDGMQAHILDDNETSAPFTVTNGVKEGCISAPVLFNILFSVMLTDALQVEDPGTGIN
ncbi:uncharacterized protein [Scyliorhinus torazame]|uniref:uncharacterized protein n=1 Tax=Scyliorhinus torazame TaxID=75743 RepID=UPI003B5B5287